MGARLTQERIEKLLELADAGYARSEIAKKMNINYRSVFYILKRDRPDYHVNLRRGKMCRVWHDRLKEGDPESIFTDPDFIKSMAPKAEKCYDYKKLKGENK